MYNWIDNFSREEINDDIHKIVEYTKAVTINPLDIKSYTKRAWLRSSVNDYAGAIADYTLVIKIDPKNSEAYFYRGYINDYTLTDYVRAISDYDSAIETAPGNAEVLSFRGNAKYSLNDYQGAIDDFTTIIDLKHPEDPNDLEDLEHYFEWAYIDRANVKRDLHDYIGAIEDYTMAIKLDSTDAESYYNRGLAKIELGQKGEGCHDFKKAIELGHEKANEAIKQYCQ